VANRLRVSLSALIGARAVRNVLDTLVDCTIGFVTGEAGRRLEDAHASNALGLSNDLACNIATNTIPTNTCVFTAITPTM
jgi:hypothetical protein